MNFVERMETTNMALVAEVLTGLKTAAEAIDSVTKIVAAVRSGVDYVTRKHPQVKTDLVLMVEEMRKTMLVLAQASAVLTQFRFASSPVPDPRELARFNDYFIQHKTKAEVLRRGVDDLRGHCSVVRKHAMKIGAGATGGIFAGVFEKLGLRSTQMEQDLATRLDRLSYEDYLVSDSAHAMMDAVDKALADVQKSLGDGGLMRSENVPAAAALLSEYASAFEPVEQTARRAAEEIARTVVALS